jgi:hypothetical protein
MVGLVAAAFLALVAGSMIYFTMLSWRRQLSAVDLHRDATVAADLIGRKLRAAPRRGVSAIGGVLQIAQGTGTVSFAAQGGDLVYDPDVSVSGNEHVLLHDHLVSFAPTVHYAWVTTRITLSDGDESVQVDTATYWRN